MVFRFLESLPRVNPAEITRIPARIVGTDCVLLWGAIETQFAEKLRFEYVRPPLSFRTDLESLSFEVGSPRYLENGGTRRSRA